MAPHSQMSVSRGAVPGIAGLLPVGAQPGEVLGAAKRESRQSADNGPLRKRAVADGSRPALRRESVGCSARGGPGLAEPGEAELLSAFFRGRGAKQE